MLARCEQDCLANQDAACEAGLLAPLLSIASAGADKLAAKSAALAVATLTCNHTANQDAVRSFTHIQLILPFHALLRCHQYSLLVFKNQSAFQDPQCCRMSSSECANAHATVQCNITSCMSLVPSDLQNLPTARCTVCVVAPFGVYICTSLDHMVQAG